MRRKFSKKTKMAAWQRSNGHCEECGKPIRPGDGPEYDHDREDFFNGSNELENCKVLCIPCHSAKTSERAPVIAKSRRHIVRAAKAKPKRQGFRGWRKFNGDIVYR